MLVQKSVEKHTKMRITLSGPEINEILRKYAEGQGYTLRGYGLSVGPQGSVSFTGYTASEVSWETEAA